MLFTYAAYLRQLERREMIRVTQTKADAERGRTERNTSGSKRDFTTP